MMEEQLKLEALAERKEQLRLSLQEVSRLRGSSNLVEWSDIESEFTEREAGVRQRIDELVAKERNYEVRNKQVLDEIEKRVRAVAESESRLKQREDLLQEQRSPGGSSGSGDHMMVEAAASPVDHGTPLPLPLPSPSPSKVTNAEVRVRPFLKSLCENMDAEGLRKYVVDHRKDMAALRNELPGALRNHASEPARLVLSAVEGVVSHVADASGNGNGGGGTSSIRKGRVLLLEALATVLGDGSSGAVLLDHELRSLATDLAEDWRSRMDVHGNGTTDVDAQAFLLLVATFGLASEYDEEELCNLVVTIAQRKQAPALCKALNLSHKIPDIVEQLSNDGKQMEALMFAHAFQIMDQFQPIELLNAYLKDARQQRNGENAENFSKELAALKVVLKCIDDYGLQAEYPQSSLQKRIAHLENMKSERKRTGGSFKGQSKRPRNGGHGRGGSYHRSSEQHHQPHHHRHHQKQQHHQNQHQHQHQQNQQQQAVYRNVPSVYSSVPQASLSGAYTTYVGAGPAVTSAPTLVYSLDGAAYNSSIYGTPQPAPLPAPLYNNYQIAGLLQQGYQPAYMR